MILETPNSRYPVSPDDIVKALVKNLPEQEFSTGLLPSDIVYVWQKGQKRIVVSYRKPQITGIWLEGSEDALHVPLPGLLMARSWSEAQYSKPHYYVAATLRKPQMGSKLFNAPLPNAGNASSICWGTVDTPSGSVLKTCDMTQDWTFFLGSRFGSHSVSRKSKSQPEDIRKLLIKLDESKSRTFPKDEMVSEKLTFADWIKSICR